MADRLALKRLSASDLTFFENLFRSLNVGNQKSINLNADVFIQQFYPALPSLVGSVVSDVIAVTLTLLGPSAAPPYTISRAVTKRDAYKNWRLNGEFVRDPEGQPGRFDVLVANDLALIEFAGDPAPQKLSVLLLAQNSPTDAALHSVLTKKITRRTMVQVSRAEIAEAAKDISSSHPVWAFAEDLEFEAALEDAALGGIAGTELLVKKVSKAVSEKALAAAKLSAEKNGRDGEAIAWSHLKRLKSGGRYSKIEWASKSNAVSSYDFLSEEVGGDQVLIDAKSTNGEFANRLHISIAELREAASAKRYVLWRVYRLNEDGALLRVSESISAFAKTILAGFSTPTGVTVDGVSIDPACLNWNAEIQIERPDEADSED